MIHRRIFRVCTLVIILLGSVFLPTTARADDAAVAEAVKRGSDTAKGGFRNEEDVRDKFNAWKTDPDAREWLTILNDRLDDIEAVTASIPRGEKAKTDVEVRITTPKGETRHGISIKLVSNPTGFNQIDKRWVDAYATMWDMPPDVVDALKLFVGETPPTEKGRDARRMFLDELPPESQQKVVGFFSKHRDMVMTDLFGGRGPHAAAWFLVTVRERHADDHTAANADWQDETRWVLVSTAEAADFFGGGDVTITPKGSLRIGRLTMQRKGGDGGRNSAKMLQFKIKPTDLFEREGSGSLVPDSRQVAKPPPNSTEQGDDTGE